jgi:type IV secretory pathway VirJ component
MVLPGEVDQVCAPATTRAFVAATGSARLFSLPNVGHGFAVPRNWEPQFLEAYRAIVSARPAHDTPRVSVPEVQDLPLVEVPATTATDRRDMAIIVTGDGGWAELDKSVAAGLADAGIPTVGLSSLRYFWTPRTPEAAAADLGAHHHALRGCMAHRSRHLDRLLVRCRRSAVSGQ